MVARKDVHVDVRHLLKRRLTVGKKVGLRPRAEIHEAFLALGC